MLIAALIAKKSKFITNTFDSYGSVKEFSQNGGSVKEFSQNGLQALA
ncbi:hypothetical protein [Flintibacter sp.]